MSDVEQNLHRVADGFLALASAKPLPRRVFDTPSHISIAPESLSAFDSDVKELKSISGLVLRDTDETQFTVFAKLLTPLKLGGFGAIKWVKYLEPTNGPDNSLAFCYSDLREAKIMLAWKGLEAKLVEQPNPHLAIAYNGLGDTIQIIRSELKQEVESKIGEDRTVSLVAYNLTK